jgi:hypothetical protein
MSWDGDKSCRNIMIFLLLCISVMVDEYLEVSCRIRVVWSLAQGIAEGLSIEVCDMLFFASN